MAASRSNVVSVARVLCLAASPPAKPTFHTLPALNVNICPIITNSVYASKAIRLLRQHKRRAQLEQFYQRFTHALRLAIDYQPLR